MATRRTGSAVHDLTRKLPAELLLEIFHILKAMDGANRYGFAAPWVRISWVCRRWRAIALGSKTLWSSVMIVKKPIEYPSGMLTELLSRSGDAVLDLRLKCTSMTDLNKKLLSVAGARSSRRVDTLDVTYPEKTSANLKARITAFGATLQSLQLHCVKVRRSYTWVFDPHDLPFLQTLSMTSVIPRATAPYGSITKLEIRNHLDTNHLLPFLGFLPFLKELLLKTPRSLVRSFYDLDALSSMPFIPTLRLFQLTGADLDISWFPIPSRHPPQLRKVYLQVRPIPGTAVRGQAFQGLPPQKLKYILPLISRPSSLPSHSDLGVATPGVDITLIGTTNATKGREDVDEQLQQWSFVLPRPPPEKVRSFLEECAPLIQRMPLRVDGAIILRLELHVAHGLSLKQDWVAWFNGFPRVQDLVLGCGSLVAEILPHLRCNLRLLPSLKALKLCLCKLDDGSTLVFSPADFCQWLRNRRTLEIPLARLSIREPADRPNAIRADVLDLHLGHFILCQVRPCDTNIEWGHAPVKGSCMVCDASYSETGQ